MKKTILTITAIIAVAVAGYYFYTTSKVAGVTARTPGVLYNVIGTRIGTTTTEVAFPSEALKATTTYPIQMQTSVDTATFYIQAVEASTTAHVDLQFLASGDYGCGTATTSSPILNQPLVTEIEWYDVGTTLLNLAGSATIPVATSTVIWNPTVGEQFRTVTLTNLNARCLAVRASGKDVSLYVGVMTKSHLGY